MNKGLLIGIILIMLLLFTGLVVAMESSNFAINWDVIGGTGGDVASTSYQIDGTFGQVVTGFSSGNTYQVGSGFWYGEASEGNAVYLPMIIK